MFTLDRLPRCDFRLLSCRPVLPRERKAEFDFLKEAHCGTCQKVMVRACRRPGEFGCRGRVR